MQIKESIPEEIIICLNCGKEYKPNKSNPMIKCSYCHVKFETTPALTPKIKNTIKEKCQRCSHTFKPRTIIDNPVCPKCHRLA